PTSHRGYLYFDSEVSLGVIYYISHATATIAFASIAYTGPGRSVRETPGLDRRRDTAAGRSAARPGDCPIAGREPHSGTRSATPPGRRRIGGNRAEPLDASCSARSRESHRDLHDHCGARGARASESFRGAHAKRSRTTAPCQSPHAKGNLAQRCDGGPGCR